MMEEIANRREGNPRTAKEHKGIPITMDDVEETHAIGANYLVGRL
jgi:hypothetical protein